MRLALEEANAAAKRGEIPVGAVLIDGNTGRIVARAGNMTIDKHDPTAHAEINVIRSRCQELGAQRLPDHDLYVTLEPCPMCAAAIANARIRRLYFGAYDPKGGGVDHGAKIFNQSTCHHKPDVISGVDEAACADILRKFFEERR